MATKSKLELAVDAGKWEEGLRKAQNSMKAFEDSIGGLEKATAAEKEQMAKFIQILGNTKSSAATTSQQVKEYRSTIERLQVISEKLNGEQKKLADEAMAKLTDRMQEAKMKADQLNASMNNTAGETAKMSSQGNEGSSILDRLAGKFGLSAKEATTLGASVAAVTGALNIAKDAFLASEANIDEWGRVTRSAQTAYEGFLTALNTGDIGGYLSRIDQIVSAARTAYNELDRLSTQKAINNKAYQEQNVENERLRAMLRTGRYIAPNDGRGNAKGLNEGDKLTKEQLENIANNLKKGLERTNDIVRAEITQTTKSINALYEEQVAVLGVSKKAFMDATKDMDSFDKAMRKYNQYLEFENQHSATVSMNIAGGATNYSVRDGAKNPYEAYKWVGVFGDDKEKFSHINELINQRAALQSQNYNSIAQSYRSLNRAEGSGGGKGASSSPSVSIKGLSLPDISSLPLLVTESMSYLESQMKMYKSMLANPSDIFEASAAQQGIEQIKKQMEAQPIALSLGVSTESIVAVKEKMDSFFDENPIELLPVVATSSTSSIATDAASTAKAWQAATRAISSAGNAMQNLEDPSAKVAGIVMQAIANIALGFAQASASPATGAAGVFGWIAAATAGVATMTATIAQIKSATKMADGGIVGGNSYVGDKIPILANAGEIVLNASQQRTLADNLEARSTATSGGNSTISGEQIVTVINAYGRRTGRGEILK